MEQHAHLDLNYLVMHNGRVCYKAGRAVLYPGHLALMIHAQHLPVTLRAADTPSVPRIWT